jgi:Fic family protein
VAKKPPRYKHAAESISGEDTGLGGEVYGVREGAGEYEPPERTPQEREDSTHPLDSTRFFETARGIKTYSEVSEILAVSVVKSVEAIIDRTPEEITITSEWICRLHADIAGSLFPDWAGRFRDINVRVGSHTPPPYFEVPVHMRLYCEDLSVRLSSTAQIEDIEGIAETLAFADWRFQWIQPFKDFNGRIGRIILSAILFRLELPPAGTASVDPEGKKRYLDALHAADAGDLSLLAEIWVERLSEALKDKGGI